MLAFFCATPIGSAAAGPIFEYIGYYGTFGLSGACSLVAILYAIFFIKETVKISRDDAIKLFLLRILISPKLRNRKKIVRMSEPA